MRNYDPRHEPGWLWVSAIVGLLLVSLACGDRSPEEEPPPAAEPEAEADAGVNPVPFPAGFNVPTDRTTIEDWVFASPQNTEAMFGHAWDIWNGMFQPSGEYQQQPDGRRELVVFETWASDVDVFDSGVTSLEQLASAMPARNVKPFHVPRQLNHPAFAEAAPPDTDPEQVLAFVKYDPVAASHIVTQGYNRASTLNEIQASWPSGTPVLDRQIDEFEPASIAIKPVWYLVKQTGLTVFPVWPGPPSPAKSFGPGDWDTCVLVDPTNQGGGGTQQGDCNGTQKDLPVVNLDQFHFQQLTAEEAADILELQPTGDDLKGAAEGDYTILVAMHVTSKELQRWTWQTFWWTTDPDAPDAPSSAEAAAARPANLPGAASHYATCTAYSMVVPAQPITGGTNLCEQVTDPGCLFCFNPYLEAGFGPSTVGPDRYGIQTNCMSCHAGAPWPPSAPVPTYVADQYVDLGGSEFSEVTKLDFLWSLQNAK